VLSLIGLAVLIYVSVTGGSIWHQIALPVFGVSLILLYTASALYHLLPLSEAGIRFLRRLDHMMIFVLIAGTYTPFCLLVLRGAWGWSLLTAVWGLTVAGFIMKIFWLDAPRWLNVGVYVVMGWLIVVTAKPLVHALPLGALIWIGIGGAFYLVGATLYLVRWPNFWPGVFGFHELWHLLVMAGSFSHYWAVLRYVSPLS
jgi:hemolysin III